MTEIRTKIQTNLILEQIQFQGLWLWKILGCGHRTLASELHNRLGSHMTRCYYSIFNLMLINIKDQNKQYDTARSYQHLKWLNTEGTFIQFSGISTISGFALGGKVRRVQPLLAVLHRPLLFSLLSWSWNVLQQLCDSTRW